MSFVGAMCSMLFILALNYEVDLERSDFVMLVGSFGASATLLFSAIEAPLSQPRNCIGGQLIGGFIGVATRKIFDDDYIFISGSVAVGLSILVMECFGVVHPPGSASALAGVLGSAKLKSQGFMFAIFPCGIGSLLMVFIALVVNNLDPKRRYPQHWL